MFYLSFLFLYLVAIKIDSKNKKQIAAQLKFEELIKKEIELSTNVVYLSTHRTHKKARH